MKDWKKRWKEELDSAIPALREDVKEAQIDRSGVQTPIKKQGFFSMLLGRKRLLATLSACACGILILCVSLALLLQPAAAPVVASGEVIALEINPKAAFVLDGEGKVDAVVSMNADADLLLGENRSREIEGKPVEEGIRIYVDYAAKLGYLRLDEEDAVRLSTYTSAETATKIQESLTGYFRQKGAYIAVVAESLEPRAMAERLGIDLGNGSLSEMLGSANELYAYRVAEAESTATAYRQMLVESKLDEYAQTLADIEAINALNIRIKRKTFFTAGYWELSGEETDAELLELAADMEKKLTAYESAYGKTLDSEEEMKAALSEAKKLPFDTLAALLSEMTESLLDNLTAVLEELGLDGEFVAELRNLPTTVEEFSQKATAHLTTRYETLVARFEGIYGEARETIAETDYAAYIAQIEEEYGSLSAYWAQTEK